MALVVFREADGTECAVDTESVYGLDEGPEPGTTRVLFNEHRGGSVNVVGGLTETRDRIEAARRGEAG